MNKTYIGIFTAGVGVGVGGTILFNKFALPFIQKKRAEKTVQFEAGPIELPKDGASDLTLDEIKKKAAEYASASAKAYAENDVKATKEAFDQMTETIVASADPDDNGVKIVIVSEDPTYDYDIIEDEADEWVANHEGVEAVDVLYNLDQNTYVKMHDPSPVETRFDFGGRTTEIYEILMTSTTGKINVYIPDVETLFVIYDSDRNDIDDEVVYYEEDVDEDE